MKVQNFVIDLQEAASISFAISTRPEGVCDKKIINMSVFHHEQRLKLKRMTYRGLIRAASGRAGRPVPEQPDESSPDTVSGLDTSRRSRRLGQDF